MASRLTDAHIEGQARLRRLLAGVIEDVWGGLPGYDEEHVPLFVGRAVPLVLAAQNQSAALTEAFLARFLRRQPFGIDRTVVTGAAVRNGVPPEQVYRRPFVTVWTVLAAGTEWRNAVRSGLERATSTAEMDVQLSMRATAHEVGELDDGIFGYQRVADGGACAFCLEVDGAYVKSGDAMPLHNRCGCGLEPLTSPHPGARFLPDGSDAYERAAVKVEPHGELGPVLTDAAHNFTALVDIQ